MKRLLDSIDNMVYWFWSRIVRSTDLSTRSLCVFRIITGLFLLIFNNPTYGWIGKTPDAFFKPPMLSIAIFFNGFPSSALFLVIDFALLIGAIFITVGFKAKVSSLAYGIISIIGLSFQYSFGKIDHSILIYVLLICLSFSGWGSKLAIVPDKLEKKDAPARSLSLVACILCFAFFSAGFGKGIHWGNFDFNKSGSAAWFYSGYYGLGRRYFLAPYTIQLMPFWGFKVMDFCAILFELSAFLFLLHSRKAWGIWLLVASFFHLINLLVLNISFLYIIIIYLAFFDFSML